MGTRNLNEIKMSRKLGNLPEDLAVWLLYRKMQGNCPTYETIAETDGRATVGQIENFFSMKYGIKKHLVPGFGLKDVYGLFHLKAPKDKDIAQFLDAGDKKFKIVRG